MGRTNRQPTDKKFRAECAALTKAQSSTAFPYRGFHLKQRARTERISLFGRKQVKFTVGFRNKIRQAPYLPASPKINGVRHRWEDGRLVPRNS